jgi:hypothetical protein
MTTQDFDKASETARATVAQALRSALPRFYANSFVNVLSDADVLTIFQSNGQSVCMMNLNYTVAKTLASALTSAVSEYEKKYNTSVPDIELAIAAGPTNLITP